MSGTPMVRRRPPTRVPVSPATADESERKLGASNMGPCLVSRCDGGHVTRVRAGRQSGGRRSTARNDRLSHARNARAASLLRFLARDVEVEIFPRVLEVHVLLVAEHPWPD